MKKFTTLIFTALIISGCTLSFQKTQEAPLEKINASYEVVSEPKTLEALQLEPALQDNEIHNNSQESTPREYSAEKTKDIIGDQAKEVVNLLYTEDIKTLDAKYIDPQKGLLVDQREFLTATARPHPIEELYAKNTPFEWSGKGENNQTEVIGFKDFLNKLLYPELYTEKDGNYRVDFRNTSKITYNTPAKTSNDYFNLYELYPDALFVDYYVEGEFNPDMNYATLRLAFEKDQQGEWRLVVLTHVVWTI